MMIAPGQIWIANARGQRKHVCTIALAENFDTVIIAPLDWETEPLAFQLPKSDSHEGEPTYVCCSIIAELHKTQLETQIRRLQQDTFSQISSAIGLSLGIASSPDYSHASSQMHLHRGELWSIDLQPDKDGRALGLIVSSDFYQENVNSDFLAVSVFEGDEPLSEFDVFITPELAGTGFGVTIECYSIATFPRANLGKKVGALKKEAMKVVDTKLRELYSPSKS